MAGKQAADKILRAIFVELNKGFLKAHSTIRVVPGFGHVLHAIGVRFQLVFAAIASHPCRSPQLRYSVAGLSPAIIFSNSAECRGTDSDQGTPCHLGCAVACGSVNNFMCQYGGQL